jgi:hypothetical protein
MRKRKLESIIKGKNFGSYRAGVINDENDIVVSVAA